MAARTKLLLASSLLIACLITTTLCADNGEDSALTDEERESCCSDGENMIFEDCIPSEDQFDSEKCKEVAVTCCTEKKKANALKCNKGVEQAIRTKDCNDLEEEASNCCNDCTLGLTFAKSGKCDVTLGATFERCCKLFSEELQSTTTKVTIPITKLPPKVTLVPDADGCDIEGNLLCAHKCIPTGASYKCQCRSGYKLLPDGQSCKKIETNRCQSKNPCEHKCIDDGDKIICVCRAGFELLEDLHSCIDIDECELETHSCNQNRQCINTQGSYRCESKADPKSESSGNMKCPIGYIANKKNLVCDDINECLGKPCPSGKTCLNTIGSYTCGGASHFTPQSKPIESEGTSVEEICPSGYRLHPEKADCVDIDECDEKTDDCNKQSQICLNTPGTFACQNKASKTSCPPGYKMIADKGCTDIDECVEYSNTCPPDSVCLNVHGGYECKQQNGNEKPAQIPNVPKPTISRPSPTPNRNPSCPIGFRKSYNGGCVDINECVEGNHSCDEHQECHNSLGSHRCTCRKGFKKDPVTLGCIDINECQHNDMNVCNIGQRCDNTIGSYQCIRHAGCGTGYTLNANSDKCEDDDECELNTHNCHLLGPAYECHNTRGAFRCIKKIIPTTTTSEPEYYYYYEEEDITNETPSISSTKASPQIYTPPPPPPLPPIPTHPPPVPIPPTRATDPPTTQKVIVTPEIVRPTNPTPTQNTDFPPTKVFNPQPSQTPKIERIPIYTDPKAKTVIVPYDEHGNAILDTNTLPENSITHYIPKPPEKHCSSGYRKDARGECIDIDECASGRYICDRYSELCQNTEGSYKCVCATGYDRDQQSGKCKVVYNAPQAPRWSPTIKSCDFGYHLDPITKTCVDTNECADGSSRCAAGEICINTLGGFTCQCKEGLRLIYGRCVPIGPPVYTPPSRQSQRPSTPVLIVTVTPAPKYSYCPDGYRHTTDDKCIDRDECAEGAHSCPRDQLCVNIQGGYMCRCPPGHILTKHGCDDIDECAETGGKACSSYSKCINTIGSYKCECNHGFVKSPTSDHLCVDIDECDSNGGKGSCHQKCINIWGTYRCACNRGYILHTDNRTCYDIDECNPTSPKLCIGECHNTQGGYECRCPKGYTLGKNKRSCVDIDECENGLVCGHDEICHNTRGGARCQNIACPSGYFREPNSKHRCRKHVHCNRNDRACLSKPDTLSFNFITFASNLTIPTTPARQVDLFTMRGPNTMDAMLRFDLKMIYVRAPPNVYPASEHDFLLSPSRYHAGVSLIRSLSGPQDILLELSMELYTNGHFEGFAVAKLYIFVSQYDF